MLREMQFTLCGDAAKRPVCADRLGVAHLAKMAASGIDLHPLWRNLIGKLIDGTATAGEGLDLSLIAQLLGDRQTGLAIQNKILSSQQLFRSIGCSPNPRLRVLALAAATDMGGNTPVEFLLQQPGVELTTLYVVPESDFPAILPDHDVAIVIASDSEPCRDALRRIDRVAAHWPRPLLNLPHRICHLDRDKLYRGLDGVDGLAIPATCAVSRAQLIDWCCSAFPPPEISAALTFPLIVRPRGSHAGAGLAKLDDRSSMLRYMDERRDEEFFVSRFVDYASGDGSFRKYRIAFIDGKPYACHLAIADRWDVWYRNAEMSRSAVKRSEEETFLRTFDDAFARRHRAALACIAERVGLDYFTIDCAETRDGLLLIFEADNTAIVHDMDPPDMFPYKLPQMRKVFDAFVAMLDRRARGARQRAA